MVSERSKCYALVASQVGRKTAGDQDLRSPRKDNGMWWNGRHAGLRGQCLDQA